MSSWRDTCLPLRSRRGVSVISLGVSQNRCFMNRLLSARKIVLSGIIGLNGLYAALSYADAAARDLPHGLTATTLQSRVLDHSPRRHGSSSLSSMAGGATLAAQVDRGRDRDFTHALQSTPIQRRPLAAPDASVARFRPVTAEAASISVSRPSRATNPEGRRGASVPSISPSPEAKLIHAVGAATPIGSVVEGVSHGGLSSIAGALTSGESMHTLKTGASLERAVAEPPSVTPAFDGTTPLGAMR